MEPEGNCRGHCSHQSRHAGERQCPYEKYDGRTHSLPYEKYGPYTCPKCNNVFDTSQKFAAHISSVHYKNETVEEKAKRYNARNKKRFRKIDQSQMIEPEERVFEENGGNNNIASGIEASQRQLVVKEEPTYDVVDWYVFCLVWIYHIIYVSLLLFLLALHHLFDDWFSYWD